MLEAFGLKIPQKPLPKCNLPDKVVMGVLKYVHGNLYDPDDWYGDWNDKKRVQEDMEDTAKDAAKLLKELCTLQVFHASNVTEKGFGKLGYCLRNAYYSAKHDKTLDIYKGYQVGKVGWASKEAGEPRYTVNDHFFNVKDGMVVECTKDAARENEYYIGKKITLKQAEKERDSGEWNF